MSSIAEEVLKHKATFYACKLSALEYEKIFNALDQYDRSIITYGDGLGPRILCRSNIHSDGCYCKGHLIYRTTGASTWGKDHLETMQRAALERKEDTSMSKLIEFTGLVTGKANTWNDMSRFTNGLTIARTKSSDPSEPTLGEIGDIAWDNDLWFSGQDTKIRALWLTLRGVGWNVFHRDVTKIRIAIDASGKIMITSINAKGEERSEEFRGAPFTSAYKADWGDGPSTPTGDVTYEIARFKSLARSTYKVEDALRLCGVVFAEGLTISLDHTSDKYYGHVLGGFDSCACWSRLIDHKNRALIVDGDRLSDFIAGVSILNDILKPYIQKIDKISYIEGDVTVFGWGVSRQMTPHEFYVETKNYRFADTISDWPTLSEFKSSQTQTEKEEEPKMANQTPSTEQKIAKTIETVSNDARQMALRAGAFQAVKLVREPLVASLSMKMAPGDEATRQRIALFFQTEVGAAAIGFVLSLATQVAGGRIAKDPAQVKLLADLSRELYLNSGAQTMDFVAELAMAPLRDAMGTMIGMLDSGVAMTALPEMPNIENLTAGPSEKFEVPVEEVVAERVK